MIARILLISDDYNALHNLCCILNNFDYNVLIAQNNHEALTVCHNKRPDLIIFNLNYLHQDVGDLKYCRELRKLTICPIIVISKFRTEKDRIQALDLGADDCFDIPYSNEEVMAHIRSALRRWKDYAPNWVLKDCLITCGDLVINQGSREVTIKGEVKKLTRTEFDVLLLLAEHNGNVVSHTEILNEIWGPESRVHKENLRVFISQLRRKIEPNPIIPCYILTEPGIGYRIRMNTVYQQKKESLSNEMFY